jgi:carbon storage regulator CsrA
MLVLTRQKGEEIIIGDPANPIGTIRIVDIRGDRIRVGLDFPKDIPVHRKEVADEIRQGTPAPLAKTTDAR